jgi:hypothetical protein
MIKTLINFTCLLSLKIAYFNLIMHQKCSPEPYKFFTTEHGLWVLQGPTAP